MTKKRKTYADFTPNEVGYLYNFDHLDNRRKTPRQLLSMGFDLQADIADMQATINQDAHDSDIAYWAMRAIGNLERIIATLDQDSVNDGLRVARKMHELYYREG